MITCVSEGSYNVLFIMSLSICIVMLLLSAYFYDRFDKAATDRLNEEGALTARNISMVSIVIVIIAIMVLFLLYFGFQTRMVGVSARVTPGTVRSASPPI